MDIKLNKNPGNYPKIISKKVITNILKDIKRGSPKKYAAESNGVSDSTFYYWIKQGKLDLTHEVDSLHAQLVVSLRKIEQEEIIECRQKIKDSQKGHAGAEWTLEHAYWKEFSSNAAAVELNKKLDRILQGSMENAETNDCEQK